MAGETCVISLDVEAETGAGAIEIGRPRTVVRVEPAAAEKRPDTPLGTAARKPDIVLITLDAARPHHFSCYGYHRKTTPNIDRLAKESLVFRNAFALVPNTRRSVPTMVTGLSLQNHQVVYDDSALSPEATTLAEYLHQAGYATAAFSSSPNNSRAVGTDQGYEVFVELWNELRRHKSRRADYLAKRAIDWLEEQDDERPLHLQLHFVPPHAPYQPLPKFDRFSDPDYTGIFDGSTDSIFTFDQRHRKPTPDDLNQAIALYDGNLRAGDDAVADVFEALQARGRWNNTVILVTSDHGEAFFEHHRMSHNNTVYDEMLRVPFILRLPEGIDRGGFNLDRMATLADIVPTLLAAASLEPNADLDGVNLLRAARRKNKPFDRYFVGRTAHTIPMRCIRTSRWKATLANSGQGELFDLIEDPGEQHNLRHRHPEIFAALGQILTRQLLEPPSITGAVRNTEVSDSDRKMLEALGYVE
jgi:arylsulfatase